MTSQPPSPEPFRLNKGHPSPRLLPVDELRDAVATLSDESGLDVLKYNPGAGVLSFREHLAAFLTERYRIPVTVDELFASSGVSMSLSMACQVFTRTGDVVVCSDPTYFLASRVFATSRLELRGIPCDRHGLRVDLLAQELQAGRLQPALVYCIPSYHNPTGVDLTPERARQLVELAVTYDFIIIADEPYSMLHFGAAPPPCMMSYDRGHGRVLALSSFTKILAPGLRAGWIHAHPRLLKQFATHGALLSGGALSPLALAAVEQTMKSGFLARTINALRAIYEQRAQFLVDTLSPLDDVHFEAPRGGYFLWLTFGPRYDGLKIVEAARQRGVVVTPGARCAVTANLDQSIRLCFALYEADQLQVAANRLVDAIRAARR